MIKIKFIDKVGSQYLKKDIETVINNCALIFNLTDDKEIEIILLGEQEIQKLNKDYRNIDKATDVLSFPQTQFDTKINILGSLIICLPIVKEKNETLEDVLKHGFLHLLGYDHEVNEKEWETAAKKVNCKL